MIDQIAISWLKSKHDAMPKRATVAWSQFCASFMRAPRRSPCSLDSCLSAGWRKATSAGSSKTDECPHKNGKSWSPATYPAGSPRQKKNVEEVSLLVVDIDHATEQQLADARQPLARYQYLIHASHSDRPANPSAACTCGSEQGALHGIQCPSRVDRCVRVVLALSRPVKRDEWPQFWHAAMRFLKQPADPSCCDANRLYYLPSRPSDANYFVQTNDGEAIDVEEILVSAPAIAPEGESTSLAIAADLHIGDGGVVEPGQRHAMLKSMAGALRFRGAGEQEILVALRNANQTRCKPPKTDEELVSLARWAVDQPTSSLPPLEPDPRRRLVDSEHQPSGPTDEEEEFIRDEDGKIMPSQDNVDLALRKLGVRLRYDEFSQHEIIEGLAGFGPRLDDRAVNRLRFTIDAQFGLLVSKVLFFDLVSDRATLRRFHPVRRYLDALKWDGDNRIDRWLIDYAGAKDTPYVRAVSRITLIAAVRRARRPGAKYDEMLILESEQGTDKCLKRGTRVLMHDGSSRAVEDVCVGDLLMGPDSGPRCVLETTSGVGPLRKIVPTKGASWVCNDQHILTVALHTKEGYRDVPVTDFAPHKWGSCHVPSNKYAKLVRAPEIQFPRREVPIESYLLGLWLGDGTCRIPEITNIEPEIHAYCEAVAPKYGVEYKRKISSGNCSKAVLSGRAHQSGQSQQYHRGSPNPLTTVFRSCVVNSEKRIPRDYLVNTVETRLELLAGLIDTDGHLDRCNIFVIPTKWPGLRDDILFLARSLGLAAYSRETTNTIKSIDFSGQYHYITISGDIERVPVKVARKKPSPRKQVKDVLRTGFRVEDAGVGEFFGFELDGDARFLLDDFTITHNSSALRILAVDDDWFSDDLPLNNDTKRFMEATGGKWIVEAGELKGMNRSDVTALKACLSRQIDEARMSYDRKPTVQPRQFVIIGTTNETDGYLRDPTGNRRFWPVRIKRFDVEALKRDRDQLWAEAVVAEAAGDSIRLDPTLYAEAALEQDARTRNEDPLVDALSRSLGNVTGKLRIADAYLAAGIEPGKATQDQMLRFGQAIRELGWERARRRIAGERCYAYVRGNEAQRDVELWVEVDPLTKAVKITPTHNGQPPATAPN